MKIAKSLIIVLFLCIYSFNSIAQSGDIYNARRVALMNKMESGVCLIYGKDNENRLSKNFYYLTALRDTSAILVLAPNHSSPSMLFTDKDLIRTGNIAVFPVGDFARQSYRLIIDAPEFWVSFMDFGRLKDLSFLFNSKKEILNYERLIYHLREIKDASEQKILSKSIAITAQTLNEVFVLLEEGMVENDILRLIDDKQKSKGASRTSFMQAGSGVNGTQVHAEPSDKIIRNGELVVFDVGAYFKEYTSDISRTVPVSGTFTQVQKQIYTIVLDAQKAAIQNMLAGVSMLEVQTIVENKLVEGLFDLGLITDMDSPWQRSLYLVHAYYHYIGLDIHDNYAFMFADLNEKLYQPGMVMTMEPGLYFPPDLLDHKPRRARNLSDEDFETFVNKTRSVFEKYKNIGVRIEDDILITEEGNIVLSASVPKEIKDIEKLMKQK